MTAIATKIYSTAIEDISYEYFLALSTDSLYIVDKNKEFVECIIEGNDTNGLLLGFDTENDFLDALMAFMNTILDGVNPIGQIVIY